MNQMGRHFAIIIPFVLVSQSDAQADAQELAANRTSSLVLGVATRASQLDSTTLLKSGHPVSTQGTILKVRPMLAAYTPSNAAAASPPWNSLRPQYRVEATLDRFRQPVVYSQAGIKTEEAAKTVQAAEVNHAKAAESARVEPDKATHAQVANETKAKAAEDALAEAAKGAKVQAAEEVKAKATEEARTKAEDTEQAKLIAKVVPRKRKRDILFAAWRRARAFVGFGKDLQVAAEELVSESCDVDSPEICADEGRFKEVTSQLRELILKTVRSVRGTATTAEVEATDDGDSMEMGWQTRGEGSASKRVVEVWAFFASAGLKVLKARKTKGTDEEVSAAKTAAAEFIRDGLFRLGPTFVKLGQVISTRTDIIEKEYSEVLSDLQDNVPGFGGDRAISIIEKELGRPIKEIYDSFEKEPIASASLGQVHRASYQGKPVAVKVQRAGLKELFDTDLKNLKVLAKLLDKLDPKVGGADRSYNDIFDESAKLLYEEIDYVREGKSAERFMESFDEIGVDYIRVPKIYWEVTNPRVLTMEFVESIKLTDIDKVEAAGLDKQKIASQIADSFLTQILKTSYFHCDPHPGNLQCDTDGKLVYFDCGMMNELKPSLALGFKEACLAIFGGGPFISDIQLDAAGKRLVRALELAGVLQKGADRLSVEKVARYWVRSFKDVQLGKEAKSIKKTLGADLKSLTDQQVWRFPSTFTFIFRAYASIDGIGKGLVADSWDIGKAAQPFIEDLAKLEGPTGVNKITDRFARATGLRPKDIDVAITQPKKVEYLEQTLRAMEQGDLKIRVRSLENERALARISLGQVVTNKLIISNLLLSLGLAGATSIPASVYLAGSALVGAQAGWGAITIRLFDKKNAKYESKDFGENDNK